MKQFTNSVVLAGLLMGWGGVEAQEMAKPDTNQLPKQVMDGLTARFPKPEIDKWIREKEGEIVVYDIEFKQGGQKFEADINEDGTIHNWEKAIAAKNLPSSVRKTVENKYPKASMKEIMEITAVKNGKDELEGYEIVLRTRHKKNVEITVAPDGKMLEDSADEK